MPFGGYKAFGLGMVHEILTSVLSGGSLRAGDSTGFQPYDGAMNTSFSLQAIDIAAFMPVTEFERRMEEFIEAVKSVEPTAPDTPILFPGERSLGEMERRKKDGVPVSARTMDKLRDWGRELDVPPPPGAATKNN